jgi:RNA polymerase sigma-70 factor (ECF subfamily)
MGSDASTDRSPLEDLIATYSRLIRYAVSRVAGPSSPAIEDEVEQKILVALWKAMPPEQIPSTPASYLYRAAVRETVRTLRRRRDAIETEIDEQVRDPTPSPERLAESRELGRSIQEALQTLRPNRRTAVKAHLMGYSAQEIMTMYGWSYNTARNLIARGMADLRHELETRGVHG